MDVYKSKDFVVAAFAVASVVVGVFEAVAQVDLFVAALFDSLSSGNGVFVVVGVFFGLYHHQTRLHSVGQPVTE
jgi:Na+-translocating ferredoxin:NAD+ oxidoreductase RnfE subunit